MATYKKSHTYYECVTESVKGELPIVMNIYIYILIFTIIY
jgi:hypothetical protein